MGMVFAIVFCNPIFHYTDRHCIIGSAKNLLLEEIEGGMERVYQTGKRWRQR